ncbi:hypothetical protein GCM10010885_17030 [Alicyclobacillus cellulosilyticus]|uniref:Membrane protein SpoIIM required for sporulation n=1 Tax=Alicyclobacillus cellulosilyticus TaxID=1003997 RepID=A0A917KFB1_9BACL|nr:stage II sporulation protein M [Alicyclobacillus cellulosilyticus]GGJ08505.1 hypothetical protein GCM10010885_17030 [Alicyclobacillus cellulosilyticus]
MDVTSFRAQREAAWRELDAHLRKARRFRNPQELARFIHLYRRAVRDLAVARTRFPAHPVTAYLNSLVTAAHNRLYRRERDGFGRVFRFWAADYPRLVRRLSGYIALAAAVSLAGILFAFAATYRLPLNAYRLLPPEIATQVQPEQAGPHAVDAPVLSSFIMTHNIQVSLYAFAGGVTGGLFTLYMMWQNGVMLGALAALFQRAGRSALFWSLILPHGVTELAAIFIAGGAGLRFAHALIHPGGRRRAEAVRQGAWEGMQLMFGVAAMLVVAGTIEGFVTPSRLPMGVKFAVAAATALLWAGYYGLAGRRSRRTDDHPA